MSTELKPAIGSVPWLASLKATTNEILAEAAELHRVKGADTPFNGDAVNWADLSCFSAVWYLDDEGIEGAVVKVHEASPGGAYFLGLWVTDRLAERGFDGVHWETEW